MPAAKQVQVQVHHGLPGIFAGVCENAVPALVYCMHLGDVPGSIEQMTQHLLILQVNIVYGFNMTVWDDQDMERCSRVRIPKSCDLLVLEYDIGVRLSSCDAAKNAL